MPKECLHCGFVAVDDKVCHCPRCASDRMRFSMLAGLQIKESDQQKAHRIEKRPTNPWPDRLQRGATFFFAAQLAGAAMLAAAVFSMPEELLPTKLGPIELVEAYVLEQPKQARLAAMAIPALAAAAATVFALRGMYLAQQAGLLLAPLAAAGMAYEAELLGLPSSPAFMGIAAGSAAILSFLFGLRVAERKRWAEEPEEEAVEYKTIDAWDRAAKPNERAAPIPLGRRAMRLKWGIVVVYFSGIILWRFFAVIWGGKAGLYDGPLSLSRLCMLEFLAGFLGGVVAGSGTRSGLSQGIFCGLGHCGVRAGFSLLTTGKLPSLFVAGKLALSWKLAHAVGLLALPGALLGGYFGQFALPAHKIVRGKKAEKTDDFHYVGSPEPNRTVVVPERLS